MMRELATDDNSHAIASTLSSSSEKMKRPQQQPTTIKMVARTKSASVRAKQLFEQEQALKRQMQEQEQNTEEDDGDGDENEKDESDNSSDNSSSLSSYSISSEGSLEEVCAKSLMVLNKQEDNNIAIVEITDDEKSSNGSGSSNGGVVENSKSNETTTSNCTNQNSTIISDNEQVLREPKVIEDDVLNTLVAMKHQQDQPQVQCTITNVASSQQDGSVSSLPEKRTIENVNERIQPCDDTTTREHSNMKNTEIGNTQHLNLSYNPNHAEARSTTDVSDNTTQQYSSSVDGQLQMHTTVTPSIHTTLKNSSLPQTQQQQLPSLPQIYHHKDDHQYSYSTSTISTIVTTANASVTKSASTAYHQHQYTVNSSPSNKTTYPESHYLNSYGSSGGPIPTITTRHSPPQSPTIITNSIPPQQPSSSSSHYSGSSSSAFSSQVFSSPPRYDPSISNNTVPPASIHSTPPPPPQKVSSHIYDHGVYTKHYHQPPMVYHYHQPYLPPMSVPPPPHHHVPYMQPYMTNPMMSIPPHNQTSSYSSIPQQEQYYYQQQTSSSSKPPIQGSYPSSSTTTYVNSSPHHQPALSNQSSSSKSTSPQPLTPSHETLGNSSNNNQPKNSFFQDIIQIPKPMESTKRKREYLKDIVLDTAKLGQLEYETFVAEQQRRQEGAITPNKKSKLFNMDFMNTVDPNIMRDKIEITKRKEFYADPAPPRTEYLEILQGVRANAEYKFGDPLPDHVVKVTFGRYSETAKSASVRLSIYGRGLRDEPKKRKFIQAIANFELEVINGAAKVTFSDLAARHASHKFGKMLFLRFGLLCDGVEVSSVETEGFTTITLRGIQKRQQRQNKEVNQ